MPIKDRTPIHLVIDSGFIPVAQKELILPILAKEDVLWVLM